MNLQNSDAGGDQEGALPLVSIVIATYNSARLLPIVFAAIAKQTYPRNRLEIIVVDGGSSDSTLALATEFGAQTINNPAVEPVQAKYLGFLAASGVYLVYLDHDEEYIDPVALRDQVDIMRRFPGVRTVDTAGYINPPGYPLVNDYINEFGDPFSFFVYRQSRGFGYHLRALKRLCGVAGETETAVLFSDNARMKSIFQENLAAGVMSDLAYIRDRLQITSGRDLCHLFYVFNEHRAVYAVAKRAALYHYSGDTISKFLAKIRWRIKNNIYHVEQVGRAGFGGRPRSFGTIFRKYAFVPYAFSIVLPLLDAVYLAVSRKKMLYLLHLPFVVYTASLIVGHMALKGLGYQPVLRSYDEKNAIK